jgi:hypothetical protein
MNHLSEDALVDAVEGSAEGAARAAIDAHLVSCARCRAAVADLRAALAAAAHGDSFEPSPLFWTHFPERVARALDAERRRVPHAQAVRRLRWMVPVAAALLVVVGLGPRLMRSTDSPSRDAAATAQRDIVRPDPPLAELGGDNDPLWGLVEAMAEEVDWDVAGETVFSIPPGTADLAVGRLSDDEQLELARLLRAELGASEQ